MFLPSLHQEKEEIPEIKIKNSSKFQLNKKSITDSHIENSLRAVIDKNQTIVLEIILSNMSNRRERNHLYEDFVYNMR